MTEGPLIPGGCILLARRIIESKIWDKPPLYLKVWVYLLTQAQHSEYKNLKRGQLFTSIPDIIEGVKWRVGARQERPSKDQIYQVIAWLRNPDEGGHESNAKATMITTTKATQGMVITIDNYSTYQTFSSYESNAESNDEKATKPVRKQRSPNNINKNDKNEQEEQEEKKKEYAPKVALTDSEYEKLIVKYGSEFLVKSAIEKLSNYKCSKRTKYTSDYHVLVGWVYEDFVERKLVVIPGGGNGAKHGTSTQGIQSGRNAAQGGAIQSQWDELYYGSPQVPKVQ